MAETHSSTRFDLVVDSHDIDDATRMLGKKAAGVALLQNIITDEHLGTLMDEVNGIAEHDRRQVRDTIVNKRGVQVPQDYWAHELRMDRGDQSKVNRLPLLKELAHSLKHLINNDLSGPFARLRDWSPTEMAVHHYDQPEGLGFHYDSAHYEGIIAIATLAGESDFQIRDKAKIAVSLPLVPGDVVLMRGTNLYSSSDDLELRPEHSVQNVGADGRTAFMIRSSSQPDKIHSGFEFANWPYN